MRLAGDRLELSAVERELLAIGRGDQPEPECTIEPFVEWLLEPISEHLPALRHGARMALRERFCEAFANPDAARDGASIIWAVTRHPGALAWLHTQGLRPHRIVAHLHAHEPARGDVVAGVLPLSLAAVLHARGVRCVNLSVEPSALDRGRELTPARMRECGARLEVIDSISVSAV
ncbi:CRISPR-associated protein Csx16 [Thauera sp. AutoDN2]|jgi:CRISPR-associated protein Csx16|uniref:CRISPR-associated protein Csx16 n=1 Tax=Thauera sp. AutoDN2 TaxID=3416051 RepID=UPI002A387591|nr:CRISPR-associated protein Csx16 [Thauera sp.]